MKFQPEFLRLYAVTDRGQNGTDELCRQIEAALSGGVTMLQLREKNLGFAPFLEEAKKVREITKKYNVPLIINDNAEIARLSGADGVHLGQEDMSAAEARKILGSEKIIGISARTISQAKSAEAEGADYIGSGAVFQTSTKSDAKPISRDTLREICDSVKIPAVAIGGISEENARKLTGTHISGIAVVSAIFSNPEPKKAAQRLYKLSEQAVIRGAIFDLDGTLVDSMPYWCNIAENYLEGLGIKPKPGLGEKIRSMYLKESAEYIKKEYSIKKTADEIVGDINGIVEKYYIEEIELKDGVSQMLSSLSGVKKCVCTLSEAKLAEAVLSRCGVLSEFDCIISAADYNLNKDTPELFEIARKKLGTKKEFTYVFDDSDYAIKSAKSGGFKTVGVYDRVNFSEDTKKLSDLYTEDYSDWK